MTPEVHRRHAFGWIVLSLLLLFADGAFAQSGSTSFTPDTGFSGSSEGRGSIKVLFHHERHYVVHNDGFRRSDGDFELDQTVQFEGEPVRRRHWILHRVSANRYAGTLSDAAGPVEGSTQGMRLLLSFRAKGLYVMHQSLTLSADESAIENTGRLTLFGITVGRLQETIRRAK